MKKLHYKVIVVALVVLLCGFFVGRWTFDPELQQPTGQEAKQISSGPKQFTMGQGTPDPEGSKKPKSIASDRAPRGQDEMISGQREGSEISQSTESPVSEKGERPPELIPVLPHGMALFDDEILALMEIENEDMRLEVAKTLRISGVPEHEVRELAEGIISPSRPEEIEPVGESPSPEELKEEILYALFELGIADEEIEALAEGFMQATQPEQSPLPPFLGNDRTTRAGSR